ncbi:MAG: HigA family addiction module antitoxin [Rhodospirillales bacterium]
MAARWICFKSSLVASWEDDENHHPGRMLRREMAARSLTANRLALDIGVPSGRITDIMGGKRGITADTALRLARYFANTPQFWMNLQVQYELAIAEQQSGKEINKRVRVA